MRWDVDRVPYMDYKDGLPPGWQPFGVTQGYLLWVRHRRRFWERKAATIARPNAQK